MYSSRLAPADRTRSSIVESFTGIVHGSLSADQIHHLFELGDSLRKTICLNTQGKPINANLLILMGLPCAVLALERPSLMESTYIRTGEEAPEAA